MMMKEDMLTRAGANSRDRQARESRRSADEWIGGTEGACDRRRKERAGGLRYVYEYVSK